ncbi:MAG: cation diffusion facilitator family transporter [bacterium]
MRRSSDGEGRKSLERNGFFMFRESVAARNRKRLMVVLGLTSTLLVIEVIGGFLTHSLALLSDAGHMLSDVGGLALALLAIRFAQKSATPEKTYGYYRAEILAALTNGVVLIFVSGYILYESYRRFIEPPEVKSLPMLVVAGVGLVVNLMGMFILRGSSKGSLNIKGAYLEVWSDTLSSAGVIGAGVVMLTTKWYLADPIISAVIGLFILPRTWELLKESVNVLLEGTPTHISISEVHEAMMKVAGVERIHDLHIWTLTSGIEAMSGHVVVSGMKDGPLILEQLHSLLDERFHITHTTIQLEDRERKQEAVEF